MLILYNHCLLTGSNSPLPVYPNFNKPKTVQIHWIGSNVCYIVINWRMTQCQASNVMELIWSLDNGFVRLCNQEFLKIVYKSKICTFLTYYLTSTILVLVMVFNLYCATGFSLTLCVIHCVYPVDIIQCRYQHGPQHIGAVNHLLI